MEKSELSDVTLSRFIGEWLPRVEAEMLDLIGSSDDSVRRHYGMMRYHLGFANAALDDERTPSGKRLRPILCLLAASAVGGDPERALPAAAGIELLHNFSLLHDDIEDGDETRRHRPTAWNVWGIPQAINAGDGMYALAFAAVQRLYDGGTQPETTLAALRLFTQACIDLTEGQHLDMSFETRDDVTIDEYLRMIRGKTASLLGASVGIGAICGGAETTQVESLWRFGVNLGLAFQIEDDILGIWGDESQTGKPAGNDILKRKKSLPILAGLADEGAAAPLRALMASDDLNENAVPAVRSLLEKAGADTFAAGKAVLYHERALVALTEALGASAEGSALLMLAESLVGRRT